MEQILAFLSQNAVLAICVCLALGYCIGLIRIGSFSFGATIGTLVVGFVLSRFVQFEIPGILASVFSLLFCFTIGYEAGPAFFGSLRSNGVKFVVQAVFFCGCAFLCLLAVGRSGLMDADSVIGMAAGALTQTSVLTVAGELSGSGSVVYAVTYMTGTLCAILFASVIGPRLLKTSPMAAAREKAEKNRRIGGGQVRVAQIYPRAFVMEPGSRYIGADIESLEDAFGHELEVVGLFRGDESLQLSQELRIEAGDVLTVIGSIRQMVLFDEDAAREVSDSRYLAVEVSTREIMVTEGTGEPVSDLLSRFGVVLRELTSEKGKKLSLSAPAVLTEGMTLKVSGVESSIRKLAKEIGYVKETGTTTDVPVVFGALAVAIVFGSLKIAGFGLGDSTCALIFGLLCGWYHSKKPRHGVFPESARWFLKSVGLNIFIAVKALTTGQFALDAGLLTAFGIGIAVTLVPHILTALFARHALKLDTADVLGGQCGSGTCTAALNALMDASGSSVFTASYAVTNAVSNILLTVVGVLLAALV